MNAGTLRAYSIYASEQHAGSLRAKEGLLCLQAAPARFSFFWRTIGHTFGIFSYGMVAQHCIDRTVQVPPTVILHPLSSAAADLHPAMVLLNLSFCPSSWAFPVATCQHALYRLAAVKVPRLQWDMGARLGTMPAPLGLSYGKRKSHQSECRPWVQQGREGSWLFSESIGGILRKDEGARHTVNTLTHAGATSVLQAWSHQRSRYARPCRGAHASTVSARRSTSLRF